MPLLTPTLRTARLRLRPVEDADADALVALHTDADVLRYWDSPPWTSQDRAARFLAGCRQLAEEGTGARLAVERSGDKRPDEGAFLRWCSLSRWDPTHRSAALGCCFRTAARGRGFATEAAGTVLQWAFDTLDLNRVQAETDTRQHRVRPGPGEAVLRAGGDAARGLRRGRRGLGLVGLRAAQTRPARAGRRPVRGHVTGLAATGGCRVVAGSVRTREDDGEPTGRRSGWRRIRRGGAP